MNRYAELTELLIFAIIGIIMFLCFLIGVEKEKVTAKKDLCSIAYKVQAESERCMEQDMESIYIDIMARLEE